MKFFRHDAIKKKVLWFTTIIIILSFGVFGTAYLIAGNSNSSTYAGSVFGKKIKINDFFQQQKHVEIQAIMRYGENYANVRDYLNLDADTWNRLIILKEAERRKIKVANEEVIQAIDRLPYFQRNGHFDTLIYNDVLRYVFKIKPRDFEEGIRENLKITRIFNEETRSVTVSDDEVFAEFKKQNEKTKVRYVLVEPDAFIDESQYDETKARLHWVENKKEFLVPSAINIEFLDFALPMTDDEEEKDAVRAEVDEVIEKLQMEGNIKEVSEELGLDLKTSGFFTKEEPNLSLGWSFEMLNTMFRMKEDQIAGPFELDNRLVLVRLLEKKESYIPEYEEIVDKVKLSFLKEEARDATRAKANEYLQQIKNNPETDFGNAASSLGLNVEVTPSFTRGEYLPKIGISKEFETAAFNLSAAQRISDVVEIANGFAILFLEEYTDVSREEYEEKKGEIEQVLLQERRNKTFNEFMTRLRLQARVYDNIGRLRQQAADQQPSQIQ